MYACMLHVQYMNMNSNGRNEEFEYAVIFRPTWFSSGRILISQLDLNKNVNHKLKYTLVRRYGKNIENSRMQCRQNNRVQSYLVLECILTRSVFCHSKTKRVL